MLISYPGWLSQMDLTVSSYAWIVIYINFYKMWGEPPRSQEEGKKILVVTSLFLCEKFLENIIYIPSSSSSHILYHINSIQTSDFIKPPLVKHRGNLDIANLNFHLQSSLESLMYSPDWDDPLIPKNEANHSIPFTQSFVQSNLLRGVDSLQQYTAILHPSADLNPQLPWSEGRGGEITG